MLTNQSFRCKPKQLAIATIITIAVWSCNQPKPLNILEYPDDGLLALTNWHLIGPFKYDTLTHHPDSTYFIEDLASYGVDESSFSLIDIQRLRDAGVDIRFVNQKSHINSFRHFVDTFRTKSNIYLATTLFSDSDQEVIMMIDGAASYRIEVNNDVIYEERFKKNLRTICDRFIRVKFKKGENLIFAKVNREDNYNAWGLNVALAKLDKAKEVFVANYHQSFVLNPIVHDTLRIYSGPFEVRSAIVAGNGKEKQFSISPTNSSISNGFIYGLNILDDGFYTIQLCSYSDTLSQLIFKGNLRSRYFSLKQQFERVAHLDTHLLDFNSLVRRIESLYDDSDTLSWRAKRHVNTNLVHWVDRLDELVNRPSEFCSRLTLKSFVSQDNGIEYEYAFYLDPEIAKKPSIPLIVVVPFAISSDTLSTSWYMSNFEQLLIDATLASERGFALCHLFGQGSNYSPEATIKEFISVMNAIREDYPSIETDSVYLTGTCDGASRALSLANSMPNRMESIGLKSPIPQYGRDYTNLSNTPMLITHGIYDHLILRNQMLAIIELLSKDIDNITYIELEEGHESLSKDERKHIFNFFYDTYKATN